jgi:hypothetical protein
MDGYALVSSLPLCPTFGIVYRLTHFRSHSTTFLVGVPSTVVVVTLPQRFQVVNGASPLSAGVRLLAYSSLSAVAAGVANLACKKGRIPFIYFFFLGSVLHTLGVALLSTLPENNNFPASGYGYEILAGTGVGITFGILLLATPFTVEARDLCECVIFSVIFSYRTVSLHQFLQP